MSGYDNISFTTTSVTATTYTATANDYVLLCDPAGGAITLTLPTPGTTACPAGRFYYIRSTGTTNAVTIDPAGSVTIDGAATISLASGAKHGAVVVNDGTNWFSVVVS
jgi:hypothetical protein